MSARLNLAIANRRAIQLERQATLIGEGAADGMRATVNVAKTRLRGDVRRSGFEGAERLSKTWRGETYPKSGGSLQVAGLIYSKAPHIIAAHEQGATIHPVNGSRYLWIPTENVPRQGRGGKLMSPGTVEERFSDFDYIPSNKPGVFLAVVEAVRRTTKRGRQGLRRFSQARARRGDVADTIHMFTLVPMVRLPKRLKGRAIRDDVAMAVMPRLVAQGIAQRMRQARLAT
jgi:hypothetical protein